MCTSCNPSYTLYQPHLSCNTSILLTTILHHYFSSPKLHYYSSSIALLPAPYCASLHVHCCTTSLPHCYPIPALCQLSPLTLCQSLKTKPPLLVLHCKGIKCEGRTRRRIRQRGRSRGAAHKTEAN